jgi:P27 family predicted phage terminase small subunit
MSLRYTSPLAIGDPPPDWLSREAKAVWLQGATALLASGALKPVDIRFFAIFCATYARMQTARQSMKNARTKKERAEAEKYVVEFEIHLLEMLLQMGFSSESEFERFVHRAIQ